MRLLSSLLMVLGLLGLAFGVLVSGTVLVPLVLVGVGAVLRIAFGGAGDTKAERETPDTHVRCPDCRELVRWDARKCKHCGAALKPWPAPPGARQPAPSPEARAEEWRG